MSLGDAGEQLGRNLRHHSHRLPALDKESAGRGAINIIYRDPELRRRPAQALTLAQEAFKLRFTDS